MMLPISFIFRHSDSRDFLLQHPFVSELKRVRLAVDALPSYVISASVLRQMASKNAQFRNRPRDRLFRARTCVVSIEGGESSSVGIDAFNAFPREALPASR